ncbi:MAG: hypothetical protein ABIG69_18170 [Bacteroidota bacterium]|nr:hypothetical protein [Bacteroidota bacterium]
MDKQNATCKQVMHHICDNLGEDIDSPKCIAIKEHLNNCGNCQTYFKSVDYTIMFYKKYDVKISEEAHKRLMNHLGLED